MDIEESLRDIESFDVCHLPIVSAFCDKIGLSNLIDNALNTHMDISPGKIIKGLVLNTLSGRDPLYRVEDFFSHQDTELLVGRGISSASFSDDNIGRVFDKIYSYGSSKLFSNISLEAVKEFNIETTKIHQDATSVSVWGQYEGDTPFKINYGHSKDKRPDLYQFVISLLCTERDIPLASKIYSGSDSDKRISAGILRRVSDYIARYAKDKKFIYVADSALINKANLAFMGGVENPSIEFVSRMPANFSLVDSLISEAVSRENWTDIGILSEKTNRLNAYYKSYEKSVDIDGTPYRAIVIHSNFYDKRKKKKIQKEIQKDLEAAKEVKKKLESIEYYCYKDAKVAKEKAALPWYHRLNINIGHKQIYKRGRPSGGIKELAGIRYRLDVSAEPDQKKIDCLTRKAGCFVMITNIKEGQKDAGGILSIYKEQHGIEKNFGFLKDPLIVNDLFLKKKERIEALGFVLVLSLLIWRIIERLLRGYIKEKDTTITGWNKQQTEKPTAFMMSTKFCSVHVLKKGNTRWLSRKITDVQSQYLEALGLEEKIFYTIRE